MNRTKNGKLSNSPMTPEKLEKYPFNWFSFTLHYHQMDNSPPKYYTNFKLLNKEDEEMMSAAENNKKICGGEVEWKYKRMNDWTKLNWTWTNEPKWMDEWMKSGK